MRGNFYYLLFIKKVKDYFLVCFNITNEFYKKEDSKRGY